MSTRKVSFALDEYYHVYNRGTDKRKIFLDEQDHKYFLYLMYVCNTVKSIKIRDLVEEFVRGDMIVSIGTYCLMPNHFHILIREKTDKGISTYMLKLLTAYSMYFNTKYKRTGRLYEGTFKASHVGNDRYLKYMYAYSHLNPAKLIDKDWKGKRTRSKSELLEFVLKYPYSSIQDYLGKTDKKIDILSPEAFPEYFKNPKEYRSDLFEWLNLDYPG